MEETFVDRTNEGEEDSQLSLSKDIELTENDMENTESKADSLIKKLKPEQVLASDAKQQLTAVRCIQELFLQMQHYSDLRIPKVNRFVNVNEKYLHCCLDLVEYGAANSSSIVCSPLVRCNNAMNPTSTEMVVLVDDLKLHRRRRSHSGSLAMQFSTAAGLAKWISNTNKGNEKMRNILKVTLPGRLGSLASTPKLSMAGSIEGTKSIDFSQSPSVLSISLPHNLEAENKSPTNKKYGLYPLHERFVSISSTNSTCSYRSSSTATATVCQGILQCVWKCGIPYFEYSVGEKREMYIASMSKIDSSDNRDVDYVYFFRSKRGGRKEYGACDDESDVVGAMKVSSSFTLFKDNLNIMETEFVLFAVDAKHLGNMQSPEVTHRKMKESHKKIIDSLSTKHLLKHKSISKFGGQSSISEAPSWDPCKNTLNKLDILGGVKFFDSPPNDELAAIVVKEYLHDDCGDTLVGGWGLKFLEKGLVERASSYQEASASSRGFQEGSLQDQSEWSRNVHVVIPSGFHGGLRSRNGGPSSLRERWQSGGQCDCGGWDVGCPVTVLNNKSSKVRSQADLGGECNSLEFTIKGMKHNEAPLKMVNIHDGLYSIHFQSTLSAIQSFSIGVAIAHTQSPFLRPKTVHKSSRDSKNQ